MLDRVALRHQQWWLGAVDTLIADTLGVDPTPLGLAVLPSRWDAGRARNFAAALGELSRPERPPEYLRGVVVPRMYRSRVDHPSHPEVAPPNAVSSRAVLICLMLAHGVELDDSLAAAADWSASVGSVDCLSNALRSYTELRDLGERGVVSYVADRGGRQLMRPSDIVWNGAEDEDFRRSFSELIGEIFPEVGLEEERRRAREGVGAFRDWSLLTISVTLLSELLDDLATVDQASTYSRASAWFPSHKHLRVLSLLASHGASVPAGFVDAAVSARLIDIEVPSFDLDVQAVVQLRRNSDVLERWRSALTEALVALDRLPKGAAANVERDELQRIMEGHAVRFAKEAESEFRPAAAFSKSAKTLGFGLLGGAAGGLVSGSILGAAISAAVSGGTRAAADAVSDSSEAAAGRAALGAARDHAVIFAGRL